MSLSLKIAFRYLLGKKSRNMINVIAIISFITIVVVSASLIIVLSAFNGLENKIKLSYKTVDAELKINFKNKKYFLDAENKLDQIRKIDNIFSASPIIEESVLFHYDGKQQIGTIKGIDSSYYTTLSIDTLIKTGSSNLFIQGKNAGLIGGGLRDILEINLEDKTKPIDIYFPKRGKISLLEPFKMKKIIPNGIFEVDHEMTLSTIFIDINLAKEIVQLDDKQYSSIEIKLKEESKIKSTKELIHKIVGDEFEIKDRIEQHKEMYQIMKLEKLIVFIVISFIMLIASFNLVGVLSMMLIEKRKDLLLLNSLGMKEKSIRYIFIFQGVIIAVVGSALGIIIGFGIALFQKIAHPIMIGSGEYAIPYPIKFLAQDFFLVFTMVIFVSMIISIIRLLFAKLSIYDSNLGLR